LLALYKYANMPDKYSVIIDHLTNKADDSGISQSGASANRVEAIGFFS